MSKLISRPPVMKVILDTGSTNITTGAWVVIASSLSQASNGVEIFNGGGSILKIATGQTGSESELPYYVLPGTGGILLDFTLAKGTQLSVKAVDIASTQGSLVLNLFG